MEETPGLTTATNNVAGDIGPGEGGSAADLGVEVESNEIMKSIWEASRSGWVSRLLGNT